MKLNIGMVSVLLMIFSIFGCSSTSNTAQQPEGQVLKFEPRYDAYSETQELIATQPPEYPRSAAINGVQGYAILEYDVSSQGKPININVIEAYPSMVFNSNAIASLSKWRYAPQKSTCHTVRLDFTLG